MAREFLQVDPRTLRLPPERQDGADPFKPVRQYARHGDRLDGMPPPEVARDGNGVLMILNGVTRATRAAEVAPGRLIDVDVCEESPHSDFSRLPTIGDRLS
ncbi:MAG: hypothetical protein K2P78_14040 [Gemmataceae bacterium]|nr:hypothetical protein [Gemmataceae bacterium]